MKLPRIRRGVAWAASGAVAVLFLFVLRLQGYPLPARSEPEPADDAPESRTYTVADTVHRGDTLADLLHRNGMAYVEIEQVLHEIRCRNYFSPRSLVPGQVVEFTHDQDGTLERLTFRCSAEAIYVFEMSADSLRSFAQAVDSEVRVRKMAGVIRSTFEESVLAAGGDLRLALKFADILSCDVDFFTDVRRGDTFDLLVEERWVDGAFVGYGEILYGWYKGDQASANCVYYRNAGPRGGYYDLAGKSLRRAFLKSPLTYSRISSFFSNHRYHPILKEYRPHRGVDYAAPEGTPVVAVADGVVEYAGWRGGYGRFIEIRHDRDHETCYGHLCRLASAIRTGARVRQGDKIGYVGHTGLATGPHLHFEMVEAGRSIDPLRMKGIPSEPIPANLLADFLKTARELAGADLQLASGSVLDSAAWAGLLAQNLTAQNASASD